MQVPGRRVVRHEPVEGGLLKDLFDQAAKAAAPSLAALKQALIQAREQRAARDAPPPPASGEPPLGGGAEAKPDPSAAVGDLPEGMRSSYTHCSAQ